MRGVHVVLLYGALSACVVTLDVPRDADIACVTSAQCPEAMVCRAQLCVRDAEVDRTPPALVSVGTAGVQALVLSFSEPIERAEAEDLASYTVVPSLAFTSATLGGEGQTVVLAVQRQAGVTYALTVTNIRDTAGNIIGPPGDSATFVGLPPTIDTAPPEPLLPPLSERLVGVSEVVLQWSDRSGASSYTVDVAYDPAFQSPVPGSPFTVLPAIAGGVPDATLRLEVPSARTYYWRARADITTGSSLASDFDVVGNVLYVYCETPGGCGNRRTAGNVTRPFRTIAAALANAALDGINRVNVAGRPGGAPYDEVVALVDGVSLYGGYDPTFDEARRGDTETGIRGETAFAVYGQDITELTVVDGFRIYGGTQGATYLVKLVKADGVVLSNDVIDGVESGGSSAGGCRTPVSMTSSGNRDGLIPTIAGCTITARNVTGTPVRGVEVIDSQVRITASTISAGSGSESCGVCVRGSLSMSDTIANASTATGDSWGVRLEPAAPASMPSRIERSTIRAGDATNSYGLLIAGGAGTAPPVVINNTIAPGFGGTRSTGAQISRGVFVNNTVAFRDCGAPTCRRYGVFTQGPTDTDIIVANNIVFGQGSEARGGCLGMTSTVSEPKVPSRIEHNLLVDCPGAFVEITQGLLIILGRFTDISDVNNPASYVFSGREAPASATGNINDDNGEAYFVDLPGGNWRLTLGTPAAIAYGGIDAAGPLYGFVGVDATQTTRTCPTPLVDCYSLGAYERDD